MKWVSGALWLLCLSSGPAFADQDRPDAADPVFRTTTDVVVLDLVVRDRRGRIVRDLTAREIEVYEDGDRQQVGQFRFFEAGVPVHPEGGAPPSAATPLAERTDAPSGAQTLRHANLVTMVFDQLGPQARTLARKAALDFVELQDRPDVFVSVFQIGHTLRLAEQFTSDRARLRAAITRVTGEANTQYLPGTDDLSAAVETAAEARARLEAASAVAVAGTETAATIAGLAREAAMAEFVVNALRMTQQLQREQQGISSLHALLALAKRQQVLSGRKTILFFSEGLHAPPSLEHVLQSAISEANRANVSIYAIDARGLLTGSDMHDARDMLQDAVAASQRQNMSRGGQPVTREDARIADTAESAIRMNTQATLAELAEGTGGALIGNSNDLRAGIARHSGDLSGYYEVAYTPTNRVFDGRFRRISIKLTRPGLTVQSRSGYFALPPGEPAIDFPFELELLRAMRSDVPPRQVPLRTRTFRFGREDGRHRFTLVAELPLAGIRLVPGSGNQQRAHFSFMALIRNDRGVVAEKFSEDTPVLLPKDRVEALRQGTATFIRSFALAPGEYVVQAAAQDRQSNEHGVDQATLTVPAPRGLTISSPAFIKRTEEIPSGALPSEDPFRIGNARIVPFVAPPEVASGDLPLFLMVYPRPGQPPPREVLLEFSRDGHVTGRSATALPDPDADGRISFVAPIPISRFAPGTYALRVAVQQGTETAEERLSFTVVSAPGGDR